MAKARKVSLKTAEATLSKVKDLDYEAAMIVEVLQDCEDSLQNLIDAYQQNYAARTSTDPDWKSYLEVTHQKMSKGVRAIKKTLLSGKMKKDLKALQKKVKALDSLLDKLQP